LQEKVVVSEKEISEQESQAMNVDKFIEAADDCPLYGMYAGSKLTVDKFLEWSREGKELEH